MATVNVLALTRYGREGASSRLRFLQYLPLLAERGIHVSARPLWGPQYLERFYSGARRSKRDVARRYLLRARDLVDAARYDVVWLEAEMFPYLPAVAERLTRVPLVVDYDDAVFHKYEGTPLHGKIDHVMRMATMVVAGSEYVAARARSVGARVVVIPTAVDLSRYPARAPAESAELRVGWIGTPHTAKYLAGIEGALRAAAQRVPLRLIVVGADVVMPGVAVETRRWSEEREAADVASFDVGIMPLPDEPWERGKSAYKIIQTMACARAVVASPVGANVDVVGTGAGSAGILATTLEEWTAALVHLAQDAGARASFGRAGRARVVSRYDIAVTAPLIAEVLAGAATRAS